MPDFRTVLPAPELLDLIGIRATENAIKRHHPRREGLFPGGSLPRMRKEVRQGPFLLYEDAGRPALAGNPSYYVSPRPKVLLRPQGLQPSDLRGTLARSRRALRPQDRATRELVHARLLRPRSLGGEPGSRLPKDLGVVVSGDTLLNHIRSMRLPSHETPQGS